MDAFFENELPREKIWASGPAMLENSELIALILGSGRAELDVFSLAKRVQSRLETLSKVPNPDYWTDLPGIGRARAAQICACLELSARYLLGANSTSVHTPEDLVSRLGFLKLREQESLICVTLNGANEILGIHEATRGLANQTQIHPREAFRGAVADGALSVIFAHNHPSGSTHASPEDLSATSRLIAAGKVLEIPVLDHVIVSRKGWCSIKADYPHLFSDFSCS